ncbi:MAG: hypothetical protein JWL82_494 [Parcubacteria group bacterium]|nr:hypothetical protein [Parcubacteria group bacterium]
METASTTPASVDSPVTASHPADMPIPVFDPAPPHDYSKGGSTGSVIAILLIVFLLVVGAFYVWGQRLAEQRASQVIHAVGQ